jgi:hypothetical protein
VVIACLCISWGTTGHFAVGTVAERHLTPKAQTAVQDLLGSESLASVSTWADDVRNDPEYKHTGPWHYINLPAGLNYDSFSQRVTSLQEDNVYKAVLRCEQTLKSPATSRKEKKEALKFITHFIGDLHQPMHVSQAEDKGGNTIQVQYKGKGTNLHAAWDGALIEDQGWDFKKLADKVDDATSQQMAQWQSDSLIQWLWESYRISSALYSEIESMKNRKLGNAYYNRHIDTVNERIEMAGVRLASVLNHIFDDTYQPPAKGSAEIEEVPVPVNVVDASRHLGEYAMICTRIYGHKDMEGLTLVNLGNYYPNQIMTIVLKGEAQTAYKRLDGRRVCVTGKIVEYRGKPEIIITDPKKLEFRRK